LISPVVFIPMAEDNGMIGPIGEWVLNTACADAMAWQQAGLPSLRVAVNVSGRQIGNDHLVDKVAAALKHSGLAPQFLEIEVTESVVMQDAARAISTLSALQAMGVTLAIDDFGTGYSSLSYLKRFPINKLKIDKSFIDGLQDSSDDAAIAMAIIVMAHSLRHTVIAEGVETAAQVEFLRAYGCDEMQGYYFSCPLPGELFVEFVRNTATSAAQCNANHERRSRRGIGVQAPDVLRTSVP
jgi:EAL domain-containing protein (putative c-di-GMP-specific phosphodiesterase class I)